MELDDDSTLDDWTGEATVGYGQPVVVPHEDPPDDQKEAGDYDGVPFVLRLS